MIDRNAKLDVAKVSRAFKVRERACRTRGAACGGRTEPGVIETIRQWGAESVDSYTGGDFANAPTTNVTIAVEPTRR